MSSFAIEERISEHVGRTPAQFWVCTDAVIGRTGAQQYKCSEIGLPGGDRLITVWRFPQEVFSKVSMSSAEGAPVTLTHPPTFLRPENWASYAKGHLQHVRPGGQLADGNQALLGDLVLNDSSLIEAVRLGTREISLGYDCQYTELENGDYAQTGIIVNHAALLPRGRAGSARIVDGGTTMNMDDVNQRLDTLLNLMKRILPGAAKSAGARTQTTDEKGRTLTLTEAMDHIAEQDRVNSFAYGEACNEVGRQMRARIPARDCRPTLTEKRRATDHTAEDDPHAWADAINERGRALRERR